MSSLGGRVCLTCTHPQREQIDHELVSGGSVAAVSRRYGVSADAMSRHKKMHLPKHRLAARNAEEAADETRRADSLSDWTAKLRQKAASLMEEAEKRGDLRTALAGCREALRACDTMARMSGAIPAAQVNVSVTHNHFQTLQVAVLGALANHPAAKADVLAALELLEHEEVPR
jgi:transposase-like protein